MSRLSVILASCFLCTYVHSVEGGERIDLSGCSDPGKFVHVSVQLDATGNNLVRPQQDSKTPGEEQKQPISVAAKIAYDEMRLASDTADVPARAPLAARYYDQAEAAIKVNETGRSPHLTDERRLVVLEQSQQRPMAFCPDGPLSREQLDLIDIVGDPFVANRLLPKKSVSSGETWSNDASVMGPLLTLDTVAVCEVQSVLDEFNASFAKVRLAGDVQGTADGAATQQEVRGVYLFDRKLRRITRLNLAVREKRSIGGATPGLDAVAKVQVKIDPIETSSHLNDAAIAKSTKPARAPLGDLVYEAASLGLRVKHDRQWYMTAQAREATTFRRVDGGDLVAQCTVTMLPAKSPGRMTSLEQFQKDVTFSLGKSFGELVSSRQWQNAAGLYCYEVVARGFADELPVEWHYYLVAPESGNRASIAVTIEKQMLERVGKADAELVESLQLFPPLPPVKTAEQPTGTAAK
jgi:hypothetical protein